MTKMIEVPDVFLLENYFDYPKFYHAVAVFPKKIRFFLNANAVSFKKKYAIKKALMEGFERLSFVKMENKYLYYTSYNQLLKKFSKNLVVNPKELIFFQKNNLNLKNTKNINFQKAS